MTECGIALLSSRHAYSFATLKDGSIQSPVEIETESAAVPVHWRPTVLSNGFSPVRYSRSSFGGGPISDDQIDAVCLAPVDVRGVIRAARLEVKDIGWSMNLKFRYILTLAVVAERDGKSLNIGIDDPMFMPAYISDPAAVSVNEDILYLPSGKIFAIALDLAQVGKSFALGLKYQTSENGPWIATHRSGLTASGTRGTLKNQKVMTAPAPHLAKQLVGIGLSCEAGCLFASLLHAEGETAASPISRSIC